MRTRDYVIRRRTDTAVRAACADVGCESWRYGWETTVDEGTPLGVNQARYIRRMSGRTFTEHRSGALTVFRFEPGQRCFAEHHTRPGQFLVRGVREHASLSDLAEDYTEHTGRLAELQQRG